MRLCGKMFCQQLSSEDESGLGMSSAQLIWMPLPIIAFNSIGFLSDFLDFSVNLFGFLGEFILFLGDFIGISEWKPLPIDAFNLF